MKSLLITVFLLCSGVPSLVAQTMVKTWVFGMDGCYVITRYTEASAPTSTPSPTAEPSPRSSPSRRAPQAPVTSATAVGAAAGSGRIGVRGTSRRAVHGGATGIESPLAPSLDSWDSWWESNRDRFLSAEARRGREAAVSGSSRSLTGRGRRVVAPSERPSSYRVQAEVTPLLLDMLVTEDDPLILTATVLGLARTTASERAGPVLDELVPQLAHDALSVRAATALALGVLGAPEASGILRAVLADDAAGRRLVGGRHVESATRARAALGLGYLADDAAVDTLLAVARGDADREVAACAVVALGLLGAVHPRADEVALALLQQLDDPTSPAGVRDEVPIALGRLGARSALSALLARVADRDLDRDVRRSSVVALGRLATVRDDDAVTALLDEVRTGRDAGARHLALLALAEIGARAPRESAGEPFHETIRELLEDEVRGAGRSASHRSWAALAAALYGRERPSAEREPLLLRLRAGLRTESDPVHRGAFLVALGLLGDAASMDAILAELTSSRDEVVRARAAEALGLAGHRAAAPDLADLARDPSTPPALRARAAAGLALLGDAGAVPDLVEALRSATSEVSRADLARVLALLGDAGAIAPLVALAADESLQDTTRATACAALGRVGEKTPLPWNEPLRAHGNPAAMMAVVLPEAHGSL